MTPIVLAKHEPSSLITAHIRVLASRLEARKRTPNLSHRELMAIGLILARIDLLRAFDYRTVAEVRDMLGELWWKSVEVVIAERGRAGCQISQGAGTRKEVTEIT